MIDSVGDVRRLTFNYDDEMNRELRSVGCYSAKSSRYSIDHDD